MKIREFLLAAFVVSFSYTADGWDTDHAPLIGTGVLTCFATLPFIGMSADVSGTDALRSLDQTVTKVKDGIDAGNAILDAIATDTSSSFYGKIGSIAKHLAPFLGAVGSLLDFFIPEGPSPELQYMIEQFALVNDRFDQVFAGLDSVKALVIEKAVKGQYGQYQGEVYALSELLSQVIDAKANNLGNSTIEGRKQAFLYEYGKVSLYTGLQSLYLGMMEKTHLLIHIPSAVRRYTDDDRVRTQNMMKGVLSVILKGVKVMMAHDQFKGDVTAYQDKQTEWTAKIKEITNHIQAIDQEMKGRWAEQLVLDVEQILTTEKDLSNKKFKDYLNMFLTSKYDWRYFYIIVYDAIRGDDMHYFTNRSAFTWMDVKGRNVIITTEPKADGVLNLDRHFVRSKIESISIGRFVPGTSLFWHANIPTFEFYNARELFNLMQKKIGIPSCPRGQYYRDMGSGVINLDAVPKYKAPVGKYVVIPRSYYMFHVFGHCSNMSQ